MIGTNAGGFRLRTLEPAEQLEAGCGFAHVHGLPRKIDHVAQVLHSVHDLDTAVKRFARLGANVIEPTWLFPSEACAFPVPQELKKWISTVEVPDGLLVLSAPASDGDQLDHHLRRWGQQVPHHVAFEVPNVSGAVADWSSTGFRFGPVTDDGTLVQTFGATPLGQLIELIARPAGHPTFSCQNIAALSLAEATLREEAGR